VSRIPLFGCPGVAGDDDMAAVVAAMLADTLESKRVVAGKRWAFDFLHGVPAATSPSANFASGSGSDVEEHGDTYGVQGKGMQAKVEPTPSPTSIVVGREACNGQGVDFDATRLTASAASTTHVPGIWVWTAM
jgi:hypothetical protein